MIKVHGKKNLKETLGVSRSNPTDEITRLDVRTLDLDVAKTTFMRRANHAKWPLVLVSAS